jgi:GT2 family glycosyltransferase
MALKLGLVVPVYKNFEGFAELMESVDIPVHPFVIGNWRNNIGVAAAWNLGIKRSIDAGCDVVVVCNDDIIFAPGTLYKMRNSVWHEGWDLITPVNTRDAPVGEYGYNESPDFSCFMIKPEEFVSEYGTFDENFRLGYWEDSDMHYRLRLQGAKAGCRTDAGFFHKGSVTQFWGGERVVSHEQFRANRDYYGEKWGNEKFKHPFNDESREVKSW